MPERHVLKIRRTFDATAEEVFEALRDPELLREWAAPDEHRTEAVEMDFREGGSYRRRMRFPDGSVHLLRGEYLEIEPPRRLVYTYRWETIQEAPDTVVEIDLRERDGQTELRLVHSGFEAGETADDHRGGWESCLDRLAKLLEG